MLPTKPTPMSTLAMLVALGFVSPLVLTKSQVATAQQAQSSSPTTVRINNQTQMAPINQVLKQQYEKQFPKQTIQLSPQQDDLTLESLQSKQADLAAISRLLTDEEKAQGMVQVPVTREKIAIVVGKDNSFAKGLSIDQVVKIFRGEITDWSQVGGEPGQIRVIHRPIASNLQGTLQTYDLFRQTTFEAGGNTVQLDQDSVETLTTELGSDGISYALASQLVEAKSVRPVSMYQTLPNDPRYPFSQPFTYVHQGEPNTATKTFLNYVDSDQGQQAIAQAKTQPALARNSGNESSPDTKAGQSDTTTLPTSESSSSSDAKGSSSSSTSNPNTPGSTTEEASSNTDQDANGLGWLPIGLLVLVLGGIGGGILKATLGKRKPKAPPRPAPNYAEKIRPTTIQGTSTQLQEPPDSPSTEPPIQEEGNPLSSSNIALGATAGAAASVAAAKLNSPSDETPEEAPLSEWVDITSQELQAQTRIQNPTTELQDTPPLSPGLNTPTQDVTATQLQSFNRNETVDSNPTQLQAPSTQAPEESWLQDEEREQNLDSHPTQFQEPNPTQLQDPKETWIQDSSATQLQDSSPTQLQDPKETWIQDSSATQLQDSSPTQLQDPKETWIQDSSATQLQDSSPTQLQEPNPTQLQDPKETWIQDSSTTQLQDSSPTQLQEPNPTQLQDPKETWIQDEEVDQTLDPSATQLQDSSPTQLQDPNPTQLQEPGQTPLPDPWELQDPWDT